MASLFASRRKARRVGREPDPRAHDDDEDTGPVVRKPTTNTPKNKSRLRVSFGPSEADSSTATPRNDTSSENESRTHTPARSSGLARHAMEKNLLSGSWRLASLNSPDQLTSIRRERLEDRPSYSRDHLDELRNSTPSTPKDLSVNASSAEEEEVEESLRALDVASKFGAQPSRQVTSVIPTEAEIREKKERRARLAKEQGSEDFIALDDPEDDSEFRDHSHTRMQVSTFKEVERDMRLVREDEDLGEGFEDYVEDAGRVALGRKAKAKQARAQRDAMREMIQEAEDSSDEDDSEAERNEAYENAQTRAGMDGLHVRKSIEKKVAKPRTPNTVTPIPRLGDVLKRWRGEMSGLEFQRARLLKERADLEAEQREVLESEAMIQQLVMKAGQDYERLKNEVERVNGRNGNTDVSSSLEAREERGLESWGNTLGP